jgi:phosphatidate phosphatase APP1
MLIGSVTFAAHAQNRDSDYSNVKDDETIQFFRTAAWLNEATDEWHVPIHGWIYEPEDSVSRRALFETILDRQFDLTVSDATEANFSRRLNLVIADNERNKQIVIEFAGQTYTLPESERNGHFETELHIAAAAVEEHIEDSIIRYQAVTDDEETRSFTGEVLFVSPRGLSVISDIDDTVKISGVTDHRNLLENTFLLDFAATPGMAELYRNWDEDNVSFHYVSSSPWQLYAPLQEFLDENGFPPAELNLKAVRFRDRTLFELFKKGTETKPIQIEKILSTWPDRSFVLVGDSGEQDPEVYADFLRRYPQRLERALIRNVTEESPDNERFASLFAGIDSGRWQLFDDPATLQP